MSESALERPCRGGRQMMLSDTARAVEDKPTRLTRRFGVADVSGALVQWLAGCRGWQTEAAPGPSKEPCIGLGRPVVNSK